MSETNKNTTDIVAEVKDRIDIIDIISEHIILKKSGRNHWGLCPFHNEKTPSFSVNEEKQIFKCFGCGEGGDAISFLQKLNSQSFKEVIIELAGKYGIEIPNFSYDAKAGEEKQEIIKLNKITADFYNKQILEHPGAKKALDYLKNREIDEKIIKDYKIGFAPKSYDSLINHLSLKGYKFDILDKAGLVSKRNDNKGYVDRFRNRIMIPILDEKGDVVAFGARAVDEDQNPKYLNSPDTPVFNKSKVMFGIDKAKDSIKEEDSAVIMEGYFDVITAQIHGMKNVVATSGTSLTSQHLKLLSRYTKSRKLYLAFDSDTAGQKAANRGAEIIKEAFSSLGDIKQFDDSFSSSNEKFSCEIRVLTTGASKDPDEYIRTEGIERYKACLKKAPLLIDYQINTVLKTAENLSNPQVKAKTAKEIVSILAEINNEIIRSEYVKLVSGKLGIEERALASQLKSNNTFEPKRNNELQRIVKNSSKTEVFAQKNLLSLYFINNENVNFSTLNNYLSDVQFTDEILAKIKKEVENLTDNIENKDILANKLMESFEEDVEAKKQLVDIMYSTDDKSFMSGKLLKQYIEENINFLNRYRQKEAQKALTEQYHKANTDENSSLKLQYEVREQIKSNSYRMEIISNE